LLADAKTAYLTVYTAFQIQLVQAFLPRDSRRIASASTPQFFPALKTMADTAEPAPDALVVTESDPQNAPAEDQQLESAKKVKKIIRRKKRPARVQADPSVAKADPSTQSGLTWNIWYSKHEGGQRGDEQHSLNKPAPGRCSIARDSGYTRADRTPGAFFCGSFGRFLIIFSIDADIFLSSFRSRRLSQGT